MKKFKFTLQSVYEYKLTVEKLQKAELKKAQEELERLLAEEQRLKSLFEANERSLEEGIKKGDDIPRIMEEHDAYFRFLREKLIEVREEIILAEEHKTECEVRLIKTMKEIKTYVKLKDEQFQEYLKEAQIETEKDMGDLVSFKTISEKKV